MTKTDSLSEKIKHVVTCCTSYIHSRSPVFAYVSVCQTFIKYSL